jgi:predicted metal-dependent enzyme (double-stranded beta helix superfamily)
MNDQDWLVTETGQCILLKTELKLNLSSQNYRLYRFLTEIEDLTENLTSDEQIIQSIIPRVRLLINSCSWLKDEYLPPDPERGWSVLMLYDEPDFPLTIQIVAWLPNTISPIHNHGCWGIVALLSGEEKNTFWYKKSPLNSAEIVKNVGNKILKSGDIIGFLPNTIHTVEAVSNEPTVTFNIYGKTDYDQRFEFDTITGVASNF